MLQHESSSLELLSKLREGLLPLGLVEDVPGFCAAAGTTAEHEPPVGPDPTESTEDE